MTTASATRHTGGLIVDRDPVISYHRTVLSTMMVAALLILALFGIKDLLLGRYLAAGILAAMSVASIAAWARGRREEDPRQVVRITRILGRGYAALLACYLAHALLVAVEFSRLPWMYVFPVLLFFTLPVREGVLWILAFASVVVVAVARAGDGVDIAPELLVRFAFSFALRTALLAGVGTMFATNSARLEQALGRLRSDSDRLQHDVAASEERFRLLFEYAPDPIYLYTLDGTFVDGNRAAERLVGYRREELIGQGLIKMGLVPVSPAPRLTGARRRTAGGRAPPPPGARAEGGAVAPGGGPAHRPRGLPPATETGGRRGRGGLHLPDPARRPAGGVGHRPRRHPAEGVGTADGGRARASGGR